MAHLPARYRALFSDKAGNNERLGFLYDARKIALLEKVAEIGVPADELDEIRLPGVASPFAGFSRNPYVASFEAGGFRFLLATVHSLFGEEDDASSLDRRRLETYAVARWADLRRRSKYSYTRDIICLGDFNLPRAEPGDAIYEALRSRGLRLPPHSTAIGPGSSIATDSHYDQIAFFPGESAADSTGRMGVFDFDHAVFAKLWQTKTPKQFASYVRYYLSDHRPLWAEFAIQHRQKAGRRRATQVAGLGAGSRSNQAASPYSRSVPDEPARKSRSCLREHGRDLPTPSS